MRRLLGWLRFAVALPTIALAASLILLIGWMPVKFKGIRLGPWLATLTARFGLRLFNIRFHCPAPETFWQHSGFVFANHITYFDIPLVMAVIPLRFVSALETKAWPFIGQAATALDTVFVNRGDKQSRAAAREQLAQTPKYPPIVVYVEGGIGPPQALQPFRYGAFEIAAANATPYLLCVIRYDHAEVMAWQNESFMAAFWRLACFPGPIRAELIPLGAVRPTPDADPQRLAEEAHTIMATALGIEVKSKK